MDGVPGLSFAGIAPGETFEYRFRVNQSGTYWYHSHSRFQEQVGLYGPIVIEPRRGERHAADREHVVLFSDWTDMDPEHLYRTLKVDSEYFNFGQRTAGDFFDSVRQRGLKPTLDGRRMWAQMRMNPTDLADVSGYTYTYLTNGVTPAGNWTGLFKPGERVRLRIINGSSMSFFDVRIPGLKMSVVAADGQDIQPVSVDEFRIAAGEVYDVMVEPREDRAYTIFAQSIDRSGYARGTLAPRLGMQAEVPRMDSRALLTMADMGMGHSTSMGPNVDSVAPDPRVDLGDPGVGLRDNGRTVLVYSDLRSLDGPIDSRAPGRDIVLHLTGHMARFVWSFDGEKFSAAKPLHFNYGERLRLVLINDSMMNHPIHLHGMWGEVESPEGEVLFRKHTINVQPAQRLSYRVTADAIGHWAYHCHLLYHMEAGMFREVHVDGGGGRPSGGDPRGGQLSGGHS
jgi:FtsP/CotA-like multicopper oxidase with cupredoxin domain